MSYIYCITNKINQKKYVGKSTISIEKRWDEHCRDARKERCEKRPLYSSMKKYGNENFQIELLGEYSEIDLDFYENYWICELDTYKNGYNATLGGDGKILFDYKLIVDTYNNLKCTRQTSELIGCCIETTRKVLNLYNINFNTKEVSQSLNGEIINTFKSITEASQWIKDSNISTAVINSIASKISANCKGKTKSAFKYKWEYLN